MNDNPKPFSRQPWVPSWESDAPPPEPTRCKHGRGECERCGTSRRRDAMHATRGGRGAVARIKTK